MSEDSGESVTNVRFGEKVRLVRDFSDPGRACGVSGVSHPGVICNIMRKSRSQSLGLASLV